MMKMRSPSRGISRNNPCGQTSTRCPMSCGRAPSVNRSVDWTCVPWKYCAWLPFLILTWNTTSALLRQLGDARCGILDDALTVAGRALRGDKQLQLLLVVDLVDVRSHI